MKTNTKKQNNLTAIESILINLTFLTIGKVALTIFILFIFIIILPNQQPIWDSVWITLILLLIFAYVLSSIIITPINNILYRHFFKKFENNKIYLFLKQNNFKSVFAFIYIFLILKNLPNYCASCCGSGAGLCIAACCTYYPPIYFPFNHIFGFDRVFMKNSFAIFADILIHFVIGYLIACMIYKLYRILRKKTKNRLKFTK